MKTNVIWVVSLTDAHLGTDGRHKGSKVLSAPFHGASCNGSFKVGHFAETLV